MIEKIFHAPIIGDKYQILEHCINSTRIEGDFHEFGVAEGGSFNWTCKKVAPKFVYGWDWWRGFPEDWKRGDRTVEKGYLDYKGTPPFEKEQNGILINGRFEDTISEFLKKNKSNASFMNIDCDLYNPTCAILEGFNERIVPGTVIYFDEMIGYQTFDEHEYKAFVEYIDRYRRKFDCIGKGVEAVGFICVE